MSDIYCDINQIKDRMLILVADTTYDDALNEASNEASRLVDVFLKPYTDVPLNDADNQIAAITADFAASIFKRRMMPDEVKIRGALQPDMMNEIDASGWFAQGVRKIEMYIKSYYTLAETLGNTAHNPDIYLSLFEKGVITGKEARAFINTNSAIAINKIETTDRTLTISSNETIVRDITETKGEYRKQKSFTFTESDPSGSGYKEQDE